MWIAYLEHRVAQNNPINMDEEVLDINLQEIRMWYAQHNSRTAATVPAPSASTTPTPTPTPAPSCIPTTSTDLFKCGIKCDSSLFLVMKQDSQFKQWKLYAISCLTVRKPEIPGFPTYCSY